MALFPLLCPNRLAFGGGLTLRFECGKALARPQGAVPHSQVFPLSLFPALSVSSFGFVYWRHGVFPLLPRVIFPCKLKFMFASNNPFSNFHTWRTIIVNLVTSVVATGLALNRQKNKDVPARKWLPGRTAPYVNVIVPVRDEEANIVPLLTTLLNQAYPAGRWHITVVDDGSTDLTSHIAMGIATVDSRVRVVEAPELSPGWTGKSNAMYTGFLHSPEEAEWLLFVDADTRHERDMLSSVVLRATETGADFLSLVIDVKMESFWERVLVPQVGELYTLLVGTMDGVNSKSKSAAANGQFILIRRDLFARTGNLPEVRSDVAEDRALAAACKRAGANVRLEYGRTLVSARVYTSFAELWAGYTKTMYWASGHNFPRTLLVALALALYALVPPVALLNALVRPRHPARREALLNAPLQLLPMLTLRAVVCRQVGIPAVYAGTYPLAVAVGDAMLLYSVYRVVSGKGVAWKGRTYGRAP